MFTAEDLDELFDRVKPQRVGADLLSRCPLCDDDADKPHLLWSPGKSRHVVVVCRKNGVGPTDDARRHNDAALAKLDLSWHDLGGSASPEEIADLWSQVTYGKTVKQKYARGTPEFLSRVYTDLLNHPAVTLNGKHQTAATWLDQRAMNRALAVKLKYAYLDGKDNAKIVKSLEKKYGADLLTVPGFVDRGPGKVDLIGGETMMGICHPVRDRDGNVVAVKVRKPLDVGAKAILLSSRTYGGPPPVTDPHVPLDTPARCDVLQVVEGERNADVVWDKTNEPTVGIPGVGFYKKFVEFIEPFGARKVVVATDQDPAGWKCALNLYVELDGKYEVEYRDWAVSPGTNRTGYDDALKFKYPTRVMPMADAVPLLKSRLLGSTVDAEDCEEGDASYSSSRSSCPDGNHLRRAKSEPVQWVVEDILPTGLTIFAGPPKSSKSFLCLDMCVSVATNGKVFGTVPVSPGDALYLALEDPESRLKGRMEDLLAARGVTEDVSLDRFEYRTIAMSGPFDPAKWPLQGAEFFDVLEEWIDLHPEPRLVIIDTLSRVNGADVKEKDEMRSNEDLARRLHEIATRRKIAIVCVTHFKKELNKADFWAGVIGTTVFRSVFDHMLGLHRADMKSDGTLRLKGRDAEEKELHLVFDGNRRVWTYEPTGNRWKKFYRWVTRKLAAGPMDAEKLSKLSEKVAGRAENPKEFEDFREKYEGELLIETDEMNRRWYVWTATRLRERVVRAIKWHQSRTAELSKVERYEDAARSRDRVRSLVRVATELRTRVGGWYAQLGLDVGGLDLPRFVVEAGDEVERVG
jgi:hypothetical protein